jgi:hypothetical protein
MFAEDTLPAKTDVMGRRGMMNVFFLFFIYYIVSWMNVCTVNVRKLMWLLSDFLKMNLFYYIIYKSDTCTLHVFRNIPNWWRQPSVHIMMTSKWWLEVRVSWNYFFFCFGSFIRLNLLGYYLNWKKALFRYFKISKFFPSEIGNIALKWLEPFLIPGYDIMMQVIRC